MADKIALPVNAFVYPMPMVVVGAVVDSRANYMAVAWVTRVNYDPPLIGVAIGKGHHTGKGIREHGEFGVSVPGADLIREVDYVGLVSGANTDKSGLFERYRGKLEHAPMIAGCPVVMECTLEKTIDLPSNELFIGKIAGAYTEERFLTNGNPDIRKMNPFTLTMPDNGYWAVGERLGDAWRIGKGLR